MGKNKRQLIDRKGVNALLGDEDVTWYTTGGTKVAKVSRVGIKKTSHYVYLVKDLVGLSASGYLAHGTKVKKQEAIDIVERTIRMLMPGRIVNQGKLVVMK